MEYAAVIGMDGFPYNTIINHQTKARSCSRLGSGELGMYTNTHTDIYTLILTRADLCMVALSVSSLLSLSRAQTCLCPLIWACSGGCPSVLPGLALAKPQPCPCLPHPPPPQGQRPSSRERAAHLCPIRTDIGFGQQLRSGAEQGS